MPATFLQQYFSDVEGTKSTLRYSYLLPIPSSYREHISNSTLQMSHVPSLVPNATAPSNE